MLDTLKTALINTVYPPRCMACSEATDAAHGLCAACWQDTAFISGPACALCGVPLVGHGLDGEVCENCTRHPPAWDRGAAALVYSGAGRRMILAFKHGDRLDLTGPLADWMAKAGAERLAVADFIVPVPLHWRRLLKRRFNQAAELSRALARQSDADAAVTLLRRSRYTTPQQRLNQKERLGNLSGAFEVSPKWRARLRDKNVLLIDDVLTTGSTLSECAEALRAGGAARVDVLVAARVAFGADDHI